MSAEVSPSVLQVGDDGHGRLVLHNSGPGRIGPLDSGQSLGGSLLNASFEAVGSYAGWIAGTGLIVDLEPGQSASIPVIYGTASTREDLGYALPPGTYWLKVQMHYRHGHPGGPPTHTLTAPLTQITIIPERGPIPVPTPEPIDLPIAPLRRTVAYLQRHRTILLALLLVFWCPAVAARRSSGMPVWFTGWVWRSAHQAKGGAGGSPHQPRRNAAACSQAPASGPPGWLSASLVNSAILRPASARTVSGLASSADR